MFTTWHKLILAIIFLLATAACRPQQDVPVPGGSESPVSDLPNDDGAEIANAEPPPAILTIDGQVQTAGIGTYCWASEEGPAVCADMIGVPTDPNPLAAGTLMLAEFDLPLPEDPQEVTLSTYPVTNEDALPGEQGGWRWWSVVLCDMMDKSHPLGLGQIQ